MSVVPVTVQQTTSALGKPGAAQPAEPGAWRESFAAQRSRAPRGTRPMARTPARSSSTARFEAPRRVPGTPRSIGISGPMPSRHRGRVRGIFHSDDFAGRARGIWRRGRAPQCRPRPDPSKLSWLPASSTGPSRGRWSRPGHLQPPPTGAATTGEQGRHGHPVGSWRRAQVTPSRVRNDGSKLAPAADRKRRVRSARFARRSARTSRGGEVSRAADPESVGTRAAARLGSLARPATRARTLGRRYPARRPRTRSLAAPARPPCRSRYRPSGRVRLDQEVRLVGPRKRKLPLRQLRVVLDLVRERSRARFFNALAQHVRGEGCSRQARGSAPPSPPAPSSGLQGRAPIQRESVGGPSAAAAGSIRFTPSFRRALRSATRAAVRRAS